MKNSTLFLMFLCLTFLSCNQNKAANSNEKQAEIDLISVGKQADKEEIQNLIQQVLIWADSENAIELLPMQTDNKGANYIGIDLDKHTHNLKTLKATDFFATEFIENYNQLILTLDKGLKSGEYDKWAVGDLPPFTFANGINPWTESQDVPYDNPSPWNFIEIEELDMDKNNGEFNWKWGDLDSSVDSSWKKFRYYFKVNKENDKWRISYLNGFDLNNNTKKDS